MIDRRETMWKRVIGAGIVIGGLCVLGAIAPKTSESISTSSSVAPEKFGVDPGHSTIIFKIRLHKVANFYGRVNAPQGSFLLTDDPAQSHVEIKIATKNIDGGLKTRNQYLAGVDFFNAREYPEASFKSESVKRVDDDTFEATGSFTMRGKTVPMTVRLEDYGEADMGRLGYRAGFEARFTVKRSDFEMTAHLDDGQLGDEVEIIVAIDGGRAN
jgi:polyisoprenoid-binding protein YceI